MRNLTFIGILLLGLAFVLYYFNSSFTVMKLFEPTSLMGILAGVGIGLIIGGLVGYVSKGSAIKQAQRRKEMKQLKIEKEALEKQAADLASASTAANQQQEKGGANPTM